MIALTQLSICLLATLLGAAVTSPLAAQQWPTRAIRIVTGTPAGGSPDFVSRLAGGETQRTARPGSGGRKFGDNGVAAWNAVAKSQPDGYLVSMLTGAFSARAAVAKSLPYHSIKDFTFITLGVRLPYGGRDLAEFTDQIVS
jgi:tripartite-type tricarboxylate transporter receptor subunit TctC